MYPDKSLNSASIRLIERSIILVSLVRMVTSVYNSYETSSVYSNTLLDKSSKSTCNPEDKSVNFWNATPPSINAVIKMSDKSLMSLSVSLLKSLISRNNSVEVYPDKSSISLEVNAFTLLISVEVYPDKSPISLEVNDFTVLMVLNVKVERSVTVDKVVEIFVEILVDVSVLNSPISRDNSVEVYPDKSPISLEVNAFTLLISVEISRVVSLLKSKISRDSSIDVYPLKSVICLVSSVEVYPDKSPISLEVNAFTLLISVEISRVVSLLKSLISVVIVSNVKEERSVIL